MKPDDRYKFIEKWLADRSRTVAASVDCLDSDFVDAYIEYTKAKFVPVTIGAHRCNQLAIDMANMASVRRLVRWRSGVPGSMIGFPKWVWCYSLPVKDKS